MSSSTPGSAARTISGLAVPQSAELVWVEGEDAASFLGGLLTNDVDELSPGDSQRSLLLDSKGRIRTFVRVRRDAAEAFTLVLLPGDGDRTIEDLERYHFSERLEILGPETTPTLVVTPDVAGELAAATELDVVGWAPGTGELALSAPSAALADAGLDASDATALDVVRVETGTALPGRDFGEAALVQEVGLEERAVSFSKGCYLGQETVARVEHRGNVRRRLRAVLAGGPIREGAHVLRDGADIGTLGTTIQRRRGSWAGLAVLRGADPGITVHIEGHEGEVAAVPFDV